MTYEEWISHYVPVVEARHVRDYTVWLRFEDGVEGEADLSDVAFKPGEWVAPLRDIEYFKNFTLNDVTIEWPNQYDVAPEFLHLKVLGYDPARIIAES